MIIIDHQWKLLSATTKNENNDGGLVQCNSNNTGDHPKEMLLMVTMNT